MYNENENQSAMKQKHKTQPDNKTNFVLFETNEEQK